MSLSLLFPNEHKAKVMLQVGYIYIRLVTYTYIHIRRYTASMVKVPSKTNQSIYIRNEVVAYIYRHTCIHTIKKKT